MNRHVSAIAGRVSLRPVAIGRGSPGLRSSPWQWYLSALARVWLVTWVYSIGVSLAS